MTSPPTYAQALRALLICAVVPLAQVLLLHLALHARFGPNNLVFGSYGWDVYPLLAVTAVYCFLAFFRQGLFTPRFSRRQLRSLALSALALGALLANYPRAVRFAGAELATFCLLAIAVFFLLSGARLFLDPPGGLLGLVRRQATRVLFASLAFASLALLPLIQESSWRLLSRVTGLVAFGLIKLSGTAVKLHVSPYISLENPYFFADVKLPCSGLEGIGYFFFFYASVRLLEGFSLRPWRELQLGLAGLATVLFLNSLRIALLFVVAVNARRHFSSRAVSDAFVWAFHSNAGWFLYLAGLLLFFRLVFKLRPGVDYSQPPGLPT